jgi:hypothetical protein
VLQRMKRQNRDDSDQCCAASEGECDPITDDSPLVHVLLVDYAKRIHKYQTRLTRDLIMITFRIHMTLR